MTGILRLLVLVTQVIAQGAGGSVAGQIVSAGNGAPAASLRVALMPVDSQAANVSVLAALGQTDSSGRYRIDNIEPGAYYITAGLVDQPTYYPGVIARAEARVVTITAGASVSGLDFKIVTPVTRPPGSAIFNVPTPLPTFSISGRFVSESGDPLLPNLRAILSTGQSATIRPDGTFEISGVLAGTYQLRASLPLSGKPMSITVVDRNVPGIIVRVPITGRIVGSIESPTGPLTEPISLSIRRDTDPLNRIAVSSAQSFALDLEESTYRIAPEKIPEGYRITSITVFPSDLQPNVLRVSRDEPVRVTVNVVGAAIGARPSVGEIPTKTLLPELTGLVKAEGAAPAGLVGIRLVDDSGARSTAIVDMSLSNPVFKLAVPAGEYRVQVFFPAVTGGPSPWRVKSVTYGASDLLAAPLRVGGETSRQIEIVLAPRD